MTIDWGEVLIGAYLILPGPEDAATAGTTLLPSAAVGLGLIADGLIGSKFVKSLF